MAIEVCVSICFQPFFSSSAKGAYHRNQYLWGRQSISLEALVTAKISQSSQSRCQISGEGNLGLVSQVHLRSYW